MKKFYGETIDSISPEFLLQATPFVKNTRYNFDNELTIDFFFNNLFLDRIDSTEKDKEKAKAIDDRNKSFDKHVKEALKCLDNPFSRVDMLHISGYGGCGKTTYLRHLIWNCTKSDLKLENIFIDFEGKNFAYEALLENIDLMLKTNFQSKVSYLNKAEAGQIFSWSKFVEIRPWFTKLTKKLTLLRNRRIDSKKYDFAKEIHDTFSDDVNQEKFIYFLLALGVFLLLFERFDDNNDEKGTLVVLFDNIDSIEEQREEAILFSSMKKFVQDFNYFFNENVSNINEYYGYIVGSVLKKTKVLFLLATRLVTKRRFKELYPDNERAQGWQSLSMPEHYYDHLGIINKRIQYYEYAEKVGKNKEEKTQITTLKKIRNLSNAIYRTYSFKRLFNGNIRYCIETMVRLNNEYEATGLIDECIKLKNRSVDIRPAGDGASGIVLSLLLDHFKRQGVYEDKLHLSICRKDDKLSLSRLILTFLYDNNNEASLADLYECLNSYYSIEDIARDVFSLSEIKRDVWRRMITFGAVFPVSQEELKAQLKEIKSGKSEGVSELHLCLSGKAYLDFVIPHFEYMLSRHKEASETVQNYNYRPLFSDKSLDIINEKAGENENKYGFERKINWVYQDVSDCCDNSVSFAKKVIAKKGYNRNDYLEYSKLNYVTTNNDDRRVHQSYESRLIFGHVSYIERYRQYVMAIMDMDKRNNTDPESVEKKQIDINKRMVRLIRKYLELYNDSSKCYQSDSQTQAWIKLMEFVKVIEQSEFKDFKTIIELSYPR